MGILHPPEGRLDYRMEPLHTGKDSRLNREDQENCWDWTRSHSEPMGDPESVMSLEGRKDDALVSALGGHVEDMGDRTLMATSAGIGLRKIVRHSTLPYNETWPQDSWERKAHLLAENELCNRGRWQRQDRDPGRLGVPARLGRLP